MNVYSIGWNTVHGSGYEIRREAPKKGYMLILMKSSGVFSLDGISQRAEKDTVVVYDTNQLQEYRADGGVFIYDWIYFDAEDRKSVV